MTTKEAVPDLSSDGLQKWMALLPEKMRSVMRDEIHRDLEGLAEFSQALAKASPVGLAEELEGQAAVLGRLGRPGRLRLLAWLSDRLYEEDSDAFKEIVAREDEDGEGRRSGDLFSGDIEAIIEAYLAQRLLEQMTGKQTIDLVRGAALALSHAPSPANQMAS